jgi:calcium/calmodulin-dependent protein kinase (CaM kinase) II
MESFLPMKTDSTAELLALSTKLLDSIAAADWDTYQTLCDSSITAFEAEARGHLVEGMPFHKFYFDLGKAKTPKLNTLSSPHVRLLGADAAVVSYVRLIQCLDGQGAVQTLKCEETRVWQRINGQWKHVHFHRSGNN